MTDIVQRLHKERNENGCGPEWAAGEDYWMQAIREIERLRLQCCQWEITVNQKDAEIERLRARAEETERLRPGGMLSAPEVR